MRAVSAFLAIFCICGLAYSQDVLSVIPDDSAVVVVTNDYGASLEAAHAFFSSAIGPADRLDETITDASVPFLAGLLDAKSAVAEALAGSGGIETGKSAALAVFLWSDAGSAVLAFRAADEQAWRKANAAKIRRRREDGLEYTEGPEKLFFTFENGFLVTTRVPEALTAYRWGKRNPLGDERADMLRLDLAGSVLAVNLSPPTVARVWQGAPQALQMQASAVANRVLDRLCSRTSAVPLPEELFSKLASDLVANCDEAHFAVSLGSSGCEVSGRAFTLPGSAYSSILTEQRGAAPDLASAVAERFAAGVSLNLRGDVLWAYLKGFMPAFTSGLSNGSVRTADTLSMLAAAVDNLRDSVGLERAGLLLACKDDWTCPSLVLVADVESDTQAVSAATDSLSKIYRDAAFTARAKQEGFLLQKVSVSETNVSGRRTVLVQVPFYMSAIDPVRAAAVREIKGDRLVWRITTLPAGKRHVLVVGGFNAPAHFEKFIGNLNPALMAPEEPEGAQADMRKEPVRLSFDFPEYIAGRLKTALKSQGNEPVPVAIPRPSARCSLSFSIDKGTVRISGTLPADQVKEAFRAARVVSDAASAPRRVLPPRTGSPKKSSDREEEAEPEGLPPEDKPWRPWGNP